GEVVTLAGLFDAVFAADSLETRTALMVGFASVAQSRGSQVIGELRVKSGRYTSGVLGAVFRVEIRCAQTKLVGHQRMIIDLKARLHFAPRGLKITVRERSTGIMAVHVGSLAIAGEPGRVMRKRLRSQLLQFFFVESVINAANGLLRHNQRFRM